MYKDKKNIVVSVIVPVYNNELYLEETLQSIKEQSFSFFEAIIVNDGSSDNSEEIIDKFVESDDRFSKINQKNKGVSAARNVALDHANGTYITFVDGDDTLPKDSLEKMQNIAEKYHPELIIGGIQRVDGFTKKVNRRTQKLKYKKEIKRDDLDLVHGLSLCNKWFLRDIIEKDNLRLEPYRHLEDGVFLYNFLQYTNNIKFCDAIIYNYLKRIPAITSSVTQRVEKGLLESCINAFERMEQLTEDYSEAFKQELRYRINSTTFIGDYYKKIWYLDEETEQLLISYINKIWNSQNDEYKKKTINFHQGLELSKGIKTKDELLKDSLFTIVISPLVSKEKINVILKSIYGQGIPNIKLILDEKFEMYTDERFFKMKNLEFVNFGNNQQDCLVNLKGLMKSRYAIVINSDVLFDYDTLVKAYECFKESKCEIIKIKVLNHKTKQKLTEMIFCVDIIEDVINQQINQHKIVLQDQAALVLYENEDSLHKSIEMLNKKSLLKFIKQMKKAVMRRIRRIYEAI